MPVHPQIGGCTLHSFAGVGKGDESRDALARAAVKSEKVCFWVQGFRSWPPLSGGGAGGNNACRLR